MKPKQNVHKKHWSTGSSSESPQGSAAQRSINQRFRGPSQKPTSQNSQNPEVQGADCVESSSGMETVPELDHAEGSGGDRAGPKAGQVKDGGSD